MARLPYVDPSSAPPKVREALEQLPPLNIFRTLAHAEEAVRPFLRLGGAILGQGELDLDRLDRGILEPNRVPTDMRQLLGRVVRDSDLAADHVVEVEAASFVASIDPAKVERIVENLLLNAVRHTPVGTRVWVRVEPKDEGVLIAVDDAGPGVRADLREETQRRAITSHEHMLAVIDHAAGHGVNERPRAPAQVRFLLEDPNAPARARQRHARRQARQSPADDQHFVVHV